MNDEARGFRREYEDRRPIQQNRNTRNKQAKKNRNKNRNNKHNSPITKTRQHSIRPSKNIKKQSK